MSGYPDDRPSDAGQMDPRALHAARGAVAAPAIFLILNGLLGLGLLGLLSVPMVFDPEWPARMAQGYADQLPPGQEKQDLENKIGEFRNALAQDQDRYVRQNAIFLSVWAGLDLLAVVGGFCMRSLSRYGLSMAGAVVSLVPVATGCMLTGIPFGIWALVVLGRPDVKAAFAAKRAAPPPNPDEQYMR